MVNDELSKRIPLAMVWNAFNSLNGQMIVAFNPIDDHINGDVPLQLETKPIRETSRIFKSDKLFDFGQLTLAMACSVGI